MPLPRPPDPVFIIGCGRSGTTILGNVLAQHPAVVYLNEPRKLWGAAYPQTEVWGRAGVDEARLVLDEGDVRPDATRRLRDLFEAERRAADRPVLIEKLPINAFRLPFIRAMFPASRFIYLHRNGLEVARSIEEKCLEGRWFARSGRKWRLLARLARRSPEMKGLPGSCASWFEKGLLEWRLSTEASERFFAGLDPATYVALSYAGLVADPAGTAARILRFLELPEDARVIDYALANVRRRSESQDQAPCSDRERHVGGPYLEASRRSAGDTLSAAAPQPGGLP